MDFLIGIHSKGREKYGLSGDNSNDVDSYRLYIDGFKVLHLPEFTFHDILFDFRNMDEISRLAYMSGLQDIRGFSFVKGLNFDGRYYLEDVCLKIKKYIKLEEGRVTVIPELNSSDFLSYFPIFSNDKFAITTRDECILSRLMHITLLNVADSTVKNSLINYDTTNCIGSHSLYNIEIVIDLKSLDCGIAIDKKLVYGNKNVVDLLNKIDKYKYEGMYSSYSFLVGNLDRVCPVKLEDLLHVEYSYGKLLVVGDIAVLTLETDDFNNNFILQSNITDIIIRFDGGNIKYKPINIVFPPSINRLTFIKYYNINKTNSFVTFMLPRTDNLPNILREIYENEISRSIYGDKTSKKSALNLILSTFGVDYERSLELLDNDLDKFIEIMKVLRIKVEFYGDV